MRNSCCIPEVFTFSKNPITQQNDRTSCYLNDLMRYIGSDEEEHYFS